MPQSCLGYHIKDLIMANKAQLSEYLPTILAPLISLIDKIEYEMTCYIQTFIQGTHLF